MVRMVIIYIVSCAKLTTNQLNENISMPKVMMSQIDMCLIFGAKVAFCMYMLCVDYNITLFSFPDICRALLHKTLLTINGRF